MKTLLILLLLTACGQTKQESLDQESEPVLDISNRVEALIPLEEWEHGMRWFPLKSLGQPIDTSSVSKPPSFTEDTFTQFTNALQIEDFDKITFLFDREQISPFLKLGGILEISPEGATNRAPFKNQGEVLAYTNQYGQLIFNDKKNLIEEEDIALFQDPIFEKLSFLFSERKISAKSDYHYVVDILSKDPDVEEIAQALGEYDYFKNIDTFSDLCFALSFMPMIDFSWSTTYFSHSTSLSISRLSLSFYGGHAFRMSATDTNRNTILISMLRQAENPSAYILNGWLYFYLVRQPSKLDEDLQLFISPLK